MVALVPGPVFDSYWRFADERHQMYMRRLQGQSPPWTDNPVLAAWRFTNVFRAADRVSQYLIRNVIYSGDQDRDEVVFRILLFKWFNRISTWELLTDRLGPLRLATFDLAAAERVLRQARESRTRIYSAAYIVPPVPGEPGAKHSGHLKLTIKMLEAGLPDKLSAAGSLEEVYRLLTEWPGVGAFLGYQMAIDLNYSAVIDYDEDEFVVAGPGALDGLAKAWPGADLRKAASLIRLTTLQQNEHFARLGLQFPGLFGRSLKLIDCQNLYCEISKYARVAHPEALGVAGRTRIKQGYRSRPLPQPLPRPFFPPKWRLRVPDALGAPPSSEPEPLMLDLPLPAPLTPRAR